MDRVEKSEVTSVEVGGKGTQEAGVAGGGRSRGCRGEQQYAWASQQSGALELTTRKAFF